eukprot:6491925-Amphidinium_carterae.2
MVTEFKTARVRDRRGLALPVCAQEKGLSGLDWASVFVAAKASLGVVAGPGGMATSAGISVQEATAVRLVERGVKDGTVKDVKPKEFGSHSCKRTTLHWCALADSSSRLLVAYVPAHLHPGAHRDVRFVYQGQVVAIQIPYYQLWQATPTYGHLSISVDLRSIATWILEEKHGILLPDLSQPGNRLYNDRLTQVGGIFRGGGSTTALEVEERPVQECRLNESGMWIAGLQCTKHACYCLAAELCEWLTQETTGLSDKQLRQSTKG